MSHAHECSDRSQETRRHGEEHARTATPDAAPRSGGSGVQTVDERRASVRRVVRSPLARLASRPALQADRVERLCDSGPLWPNKIRQRNYEMLH